MIKCQLVVPRRPRKPGFSSGDKGVKTLTDDPFRVPSWRGGTRGVGCRPKWVTQSRSVTHGNKRSPLTPLFSWLRWRRGELSSGWAFSSRRSFCWEQRSVQCACHLFCAEHTPCFEQFLFQQCRFSFTTLFASKIWEHVLGFLCLTVFSWQLQNYRQSRAMSAISPQCSVLSCCQISRLWSKFSFLVKAFRDWDNIDPSRTWRWTGREHLLRQKPVKIPSLSVRRKYYDGVKAVWSLHVTRRTHRLSSGGRTLSWRRHSAVEVITKKEVLSGQFQPRKEHPFHNIQVLNSKSNPDPISLLRVEETRNLTWTFREVNVTLHSRFLHSPHTGSRWIGSFLACKEDPESTDELVRNLQAGEFRVKSAGKTWCSLQFFCVEDAYIRDIWPEESCSPREWKMTLKSAAEQLLMRATRYLNG